MGDRRIITFDIETAPTNDEVVIAKIAERIEAPKNYKDEEKIAAYKEQKLIEEVRATALNPTFGRAIGFAVYDGEQLAVMVSDDEKKLLHALATKLASIYGSLKPKANKAVIAGHNIIGFDFPFILRRAIILESERVLQIAREGLIPRPLDPAWRIEHVVDTMLAWGKPYARLKDIAQAMGLLDGTEDDMDGNATLEAYLSGDLKAVEAHVKNDVIINHRVALKMMGVFW